MDDFINLMSGMGGRADYTLEEIEAAEKRMKKKGGTLQENLQAVRGQASSPRPATMTELFAQRVKSDKKAAAAAAKSSDSALKILERNQKELDRQLKELNRNLAEDFGVGPASYESPKAGVSSAAAAAKTESLPQEKEKPAEAELLSGDAAYAAFDGISAVLEQSVYGQQEFLRKLVIAFKRPLVSPPEGKRALNAILLTGREDSGKHVALEALLEELKKRRILASAEHKTIDLGIYTDASMEKIFLQDMYSALSGTAGVIVFEHFEECHPSFLNHVGALVTEGAFRLSERYVMQKGQLVNVQNSLAQETVGELNARGRYLVFITNKSLEKTAGIMGAPFVDALGDICETSALDDGAIGKIASREMEELKSRAKEQFGFIINADDAFLAYSAARSGKQAGVKGVQDFYDSVMRALAQMKLEGDYPKDTELTLKMEGDVLCALRGDERIDLSVYLPKRFRGEIDEIRREMDAIVGLAEVKKYVLGLEEYYRVQQRRAEEGLKTGEVNKHMIFTGSPGTGKTTIARIISKYLKAIGVLSGGQLVEVSRADLVGKFVGHTAPLTSNVINSAIGGVLFIDEAYSLYRGKDDSFGLEAIDTLVKGIEDHRDDLIVILAGYSMEMQEFLTANSGLKSRFPNVIHFPDYTGEELLAIARSIASSKGYTIAEEAAKPLTEYFDEVQAFRASDAGNGRMARNMIEAAIVKQSRRLATEPEGELSVLLLKDFEALSQYLPEEEAAELPEAPKEEAEVPGYEKEENAEKVTAAAAPLTEAAAEEKEEAEELTEVPAEESLKPEEGACAERENGEAPEETPGGKDPEN
ncbi:MAG: AAA family ATPase [Lachnospiraceae bacterium]|nr:AAA family ATPase [Lachnospiraceae bacterium]